MKRMIKCCCGILCALAVSVVFFGGRLKPYLLPKVALRDALTESLTQLEDRFSGDPMWIIGKALNSEGKYTIDGLVTLDAPLPGTVQVDGTMLTDAAQHRLLISGTGTSGDRSLDLSLYMDRHFLGVASESLTNGAYYGITYDSFPEDIRKVPLLNLFVTDAVFSRWEASICQIQTWISKERPMPSFPELSGEAETDLLLGLLAMPCETEDRSVSINDQPVKCRCLTYPLEGELLKKLYPKDAAVPDSADLIFYLSDGALVLIQWKTDRESFRLSLGSDPGHDPLTLEYRVKDRERRVASVSTPQTDGPYRQQWSIHAEGESRSISYDWNDSTGKLNLFWNDADLAELTLQETTGGFHLETGDLDRIWKAAGFPETGWVPTDCSISVTGGSAIQTPEYKNLDSWSLEDFLNLAEGVGTWIGLHLD